MKDPFFAAPSWSKLADWKRELAPHYETALRMLGAKQVPCDTAGDRVLREIGREMGREAEPTRVGVFFGTPGREVPDPYFEGKGPDRVGCTFCGACMTGCRVGAKNTLDRNYLYLAEKLGVTVLPEREVHAVRPLDGGGYGVEHGPSLERGAVEVVRAPNVIFAGGVMGTVPLLLAMKEDPKGLPRLSERVGRSVRTNSEALFGIVAPDSKESFSEGVAITSILHTDEHSHVEPVRYGKGSDFFRFMALPHSPGDSAPKRIFGALRILAKNPRLWLRVYTSPEFAEKTQVLLYMRTVEGSLTLKLGRSFLNGYRRALVTELDQGAEAPSAFMPEATAIAERFAEKVGGGTATMISETILGSPSTAHILGGACMGASAEEGVIDHQHRVFGYDGLYVIDGSAVSANPGVNSSLTITALAERAMTFID
ncbi:MAG: GMC family oxidoreductase [Polyangiaceae bacterium]|nr:GMC family oxidoreductase [Polyangiaceae bacterium]